MLYRKKDNPELVVDAYKSTDFAGTPIYRIPVMFGDMTFPVHEFEEIYEPAPPTPRLVRSGMKVFGQEIMIESKGDERMDKIAVEFLQGKLMGEEPLKVSR
jgi:hypothetical protein